MLNHPKICRIACQVDGEDVSVDGESYLLYFQQDLTLIPPS